MDKKTLKAIWFRLNVQLTRKEKLIFAKHLSVLFTPGKYPAACRVRIFR